LRPPWGLTGITPPLSLQSLLQVVPIFLLLHLLLLLLLDFPRLSLTSVL
jgi:hypothetical protein